jgi:MFS transporter, DHA1 family, tetracycline resistance protein
MSPLDAAGARWRYLLLLALRWLPTGLLIPVVTLLGLDRGLTLVEVGATAAVQGVVVALLELPTGGLADTLGRRPVLLLAGAAGTASLAVLAVADTPGLFALAWLLQGVYRALDSGPLEAWYVDTALAAEPGLRLERALGAGTAVAGLAIACGALLSGALVAASGDPGVPVLAALAVLVLGTGALVLLPEPRRARGSVRRALTGVPGTVRGGLLLVGRSRALAGLTGVSLLWGVGIPAFEALLPVRLAELTGGPAAGAALLGPATAAAWVVSAAGAAIAPWVAGRVGLVPAAVAGRLLQGAAVVAMGLLAGPVGALTGYLVVNLVHGAANPLHGSLLHGHVEGGHRATVLSVGSLVFQLGGALGLLGLTALAAATTTEAAIVAGGAVLALSAPLYLAARPAPATTSR